jgi:hypothetical protein
MEAGSELASRRPRQPHVPSSCTSSASRTSTGVERIGEFLGHPETRIFGELLTDLEEDKAAGATSRLRWLAQVTSRTRRVGPGYPGGTRAERWGLRLRHRT